MNSLVERAKNALEHAYAPYSNYRVGAALLCQDGRVIEGCNVENSSYGLTICAERSAIASAVSQGMRGFKAIAVVTESSPPASPCGACRQVLAEFSPDLPITLANLKGDIEETDLAKLLPRQFKLR